MNLNNSVTKGAIILFLTSLLSILTKWPETGTAWIVFGITTVGTMCGYFAQSSLFPSTSDSGQINSSDLWKGLLVSLSNSISTWIATVLTSTILDWKNLGITFAGMFIGYILKNLSTPQPKS